VFVIHELAALEILLFHTERVGQDHHNRTGQDVDWRWGGRLTRTA